MQRSFFDPRRWLGALSSDGGARGGRALVLAVYPLLALLAVMQATSSGAVERIASDTAGRVLFGALAGLLLIVAVAAIAAVVAYTTEALQPRLGDALLHLSLAVATACFALAPDPVVRHGAVLVGGFGALLFATGLFLLARGAWSWLADESDASPSIANRDAGVRGVVCIAVGAFLAAASVQAAPASTTDLLAQAWGVPLFLSTAAALMIYVWHSAHMMNQALQRSGSY